MNPANFSMRRYYALGTSALILILFAFHTYFYQPFHVVLESVVDNPLQFAVAETSYLYLILHAFILIPIIALSFDSRVTFYKKWKYLMPAIFVVGMLFILWDFVYTKVGVWGFSHNYTLSTRILYLPIEEWLFFLSAPFACVFIHECLRYYFPKDIFQSADKAISFGLAILFLIVGILSWGRLYTAFTCIATAILIVAHYYSFRNTFRTFFYKTQLVSFIPFIIINGVLTGSITKTPIVQYNKSEMLDYRFITIPGEDFVYCFMMLFSVVTVYEYLMNRKAMKKSADAHSKPLQK